MTIAAAFLTNEGVVFGADSTTTTVLINPQTGQPVSIQLLNHAQKIFEIGPAEQGRLALCTWEAASVGSVSHRTIAARVADDVTASMSVSEATDRVVHHVSEVAKAEPGVGGFGYFVGGWTPVTRLPACFRLWFPHTGPVVRDEFKIGDARFEGVNHYFTRACVGIDPRLAQLLATKLKAALPTPGADFDQHFGQALQEAIGELNADLIQSLPLRDTIDLVYMYLHLTIKAHKFRLGPSVCGGPIELAVISTDRPFRWVRHKPFDSAIMEQEGF